MTIAILNSFSGYFPQLQHCWQISTDATATRDQVTTVTPGANDATIPFQMEGLG
jgi:hypothetical protein